MKRTMLILTAIAGFALRSEGQTQEEVYRAILQAQQLQSYGDTWAARRGYQYNPWTSYYQYIQERRERAIFNVELLNSFQDLDR